MRMQDPDAILARIDDAAHERPSGLVAFDGDGTLWSGDIGEDLFEAFTHRGDVRPPALERMRRDARAGGIEDGGTGGELCARIYAEYLAGRFPEQPMCELMAWGFAGWTRAEVEAFAVETFGRLDVPRRLHREVIRVVDGLRSRGIDVYLVSASPRPIIEVAAKSLGIAPDHVVAATAMWEGERMVPSIAPPMPYGDGKVDALRARTRERPLLAAFGDNGFDVPLLRASAVPVAVRPKPRLRAREAEVPGLVQIEPHEAPGAPPQRGQ